MVPQWKNCLLILAAGIITAGLSFGLGADDSSKVKVNNMMLSYDPGFDMPEGKSAWKKTWGSVFRDNKIKHSGRQSLRIDGGGGLESTFKIKVEPGYKYYLSAWGKMDNFTFIKNGLYGCGLGLEQLREDGTVNGNWYDMYAYLKYKEGTFGWEYVEAWWVPKDTTVWLRPAIKCVADPKSQVWYDDIRVWKEKLPEKKSTMLVNAIENPSGEIIYNGDITPFGYELSNPSGKREDFGKLARATTSESSDRGASLMVMAPCAVKSVIGVVSGKEAVARISVMSRDLSGKGGFARVDLLDADHKVLKSINVAEITGDQKWKTYEKKIELPQSKDTLYAQWVFGMKSGGKGSLYFDDLQVMVESTLLPMPVRKKNVKEVNVTADVARDNGKLFRSPLDSYDHHCTDRIYSYSIGTAGPHLEGENRWFRMRPKLGVKYVRVHNGYNGTGLCEHLKVDGKTAFGWENGEQGVTFNNERINEDTGKLFGPVCQIDKNGKMITDFSSIKYYLDKAILKGGVKPIFGLEAVPNCLALDNNCHYKPRDMKLWEEFNYRFIKFLVDSYGADEIKTWIFETCNEPSTEPTFHGSPGRLDVLGDFLEMQDYTIAGCQRALPEIFIAGPSGPPESFMMPMLKHCAEGKNYATGKIGTKLDAISYHGYLGGSVNDLSWRSSEEQIFRYLRYREYFEKKTGKKLELFNTEFAAIYREVTPKNPPEPNYDNHIQAVGTLHMTNFSKRLGVERMAFFYAAPFYMAPVRHATGFKKSPMQSNTPEFLGEPTMITFHGIFKPVTRIFQMLSWMNGGKELDVKADCEPIFTMAVKDGETIKLLCYSFDVDTAQTYVTDVKVALDNVGKAGEKYRITRYEMSATKANSCYLATQEKLTQEKCEKNIAVVDRINKDSELKPEDMGSVSVGAGGKLNFSAKVPAFSASLFVLTPEKQ